MKINLKQLSTQSATATTGTKKMRLSETGISMVFQMFTKMIYSNPIGTVVREITSNCFDSHVEAGVNTPVIIRKWKDPQDNTTYISFFDFGVGMSPDRIENIYGTYFESSKRGDNTQIGGFGIGGKTPLAYKRSTGHGEGEYDNSYFVVTIFNGVKYSYVIYEGTEAPEWSLLHQEETTEHNGTEVRVPVLERDITTFKKEMVRQLYYFENIVFEGFDGTDDDYYGRKYDETLTNNYTIVRGKSFWFRGTEYSEYIHVCLGRVAYPIDYNLLGLSSSDYRIPVALKLEVGDINVTASREMLDYNEHTIKILKKKLEDVKKEMTELLVKQYANIISLEDYFMVKNEFGTLKFGNGSSIKLSNLIKQSDLDFSNFRYQFMKMPNDRQLFRFFFETKSYGKKPSRSRYSSKYEFEGGYEELSKNSNLLYINDEFNRKIVKQAYLKSKHELYHIISKRNVSGSFMRAEIAEVFNVHLDETTDTNGKPVSYVQSLLDMQDEYFAIIQRHAQDYDAIEVPEDFIADRKNRRNTLSKEIRNTTIPVKFIGHYSKQRVKLDDLFNYNMPIFYGTQEEESKLTRIYELYTALFDSKAVGYYEERANKFVNGYDSYSYRQNNTVKKNSILFIVLATNNIKYMEYCKKAYKPDEFFRRLLYRKENKVMTYFQTYDLVHAWDNVDSLYKNNDFAKVDAKWGKKISEVNAYVESLPSDTENIGRLKDELSKYFDLTNVQSTADQKRIGKLVNEIKDLQVNNRRYMEYIHVSYGEIKNDTQVEILKKVMAL